MANGTATSEQQAIDECLEVGAAMAVARELIYPLLNRARDAFDALDRLRFDEQGADEWDDATTISWRHRTGYDALWDVIHDIHDRSDEQEVMRFYFERRQDAS